MNKKGLVGVIGTIITAVVVILLFVGLAFPQIRQSTAASDNSETIIKTANFTTPENISLAFDDLIGASVTVENGTLTDNYTVDATNGVLMFSNSSVNKSYIVYYNYYSDNYVTNSSQRALFAIVILLLIIGITMWLFSAFGLT